MARTKSKPRKRTTVRKARRSVKRRTTTKGTKRKTAGDPVTKAKRGVATSSPFAAHHAVRMNPFSGATTQPKIPDGGFTSSLSRRLQNVVEVTNASNEGIMHLVMAPTMGVPICVTHTTEGASTRSGATLKPSYLGFLGQGVGLETKVGGVIKWPIANTDTGDVINAADFAKWRVVSQGLQITLNNVDDENDGWFEAVRFNWRNDNEDICLTSLDGTDTGNVIGAAPNLNGLPLLTANIVEMPGYKSGLLKDIKDYQFMLHPQQTRHDPVEITKSIDFVGGTDLNYDTQSKKANLGDSAAGTLLKQGLVDQNMDWMYIRIHPRSNTGAAGQTGSKLICNYIQNLEFAFSPDSDLATYMTTNRMDPKSAKINDQLNNNQDAANKKREFN
ncbi:hypothetical protein [Chaetoceros sp. DNA virus 7]|uniref:Capsid protein n=1 Tax=Chaetoceros protobacilladnavirus 2 TaxID=3052702 RepID=CAPSD_CPBDV|nr:hypothetical protein [Chaetoceros sp. DNA virus 7]W6JIC6.1 RecName: Full=Capsid protein; AltName: Full=Viral protein 2; Short=VP2 [Protobacilladnavirus chaetoc]BAO48207.1 hypothetical protein [Chaetoceros sp. DNA virus 7]